MRPGAWRRAAGLASLSAPLAMAAACVLAAQLGGAPVAVNSALPASPAYVADAFGGNTVGQSFRAPQDSLCRIDLRLRPVKGARQVTFRLWPEGREGEAVGGRFACPHDESAWYTVRFPPIADSKNTTFHWEVGLADPASDAVVSLEAATADTRPDGALFVNDQPTASDAVFVPYYCDAGLAPPLLAGWAEQNRLRLVAWLEQEHAIISANHLLILVMLMAAVFAAVLVLPPRERPPQIEFLSRAASSVKRRGKAILPAAAALVAAGALGATMSLAAQTHLWNPSAARLDTGESPSRAGAAGPWVAYDFTANLAAAETSVDTLESWYVLPGWIALGEDRRPVLRAHPPSFVYYTVEVPPGARLHAAPTLDPQVWLPERGDGVLFIVRTIVDGAEETVYYQEIDPKNNPDHRRWHDFDVDLGAYAGQTITILFITYPLETNDWDWAAWGMPLLLTPTKPGEATR
jgi:hypothetical protein